MAYRHILVPTDGSTRSQRAARAAIELARALGARVTILHVVAEGVPTAFSGAKLYGSGVLGREYRERVKRQAQGLLGQIGQRAGTAGVPYRARSRLAREPWRAILAAARSSGCDLIVMGSHGRGSMRTVLLGSQTAKVLSHSRIPVLVCR